TNSTATTADVTGVVNNGTIGPLALYNHDKTYTEGFNLLGNPYPSPIDWNAATGWTKNNIDNGIYFFNAGTSDQYTGTYSSYVNGISSDGIASNIIPSMQGFFVHVSDGDYPVSGSISIGNPARVNQLSPVFHKSQQERESPVVRLSAEFKNENSPADPLVLYLDHTASAIFEKETDALKLYNTTTEVPNLFAISEDNRQLSIGAFPYPDIETEIPLGIKTGKAGTINLKLVSFESSPTAYGIYLKDKASGKVQNLNLQPEYAISVEQGILEGRLSLVFSETDISQETFGSSSFSAFSQDGLIYVDIKLKEEQVNIQVINLAGQAILNKTVNGEGRHALGSALVEGIYMITFFTDMGTISKKIFVR
ncbi:MAG: T9SS type A sorting domain-containing protein, partial [Lentimicrobium sp.]|nr:T9SS type A sorting domain-containing protein [Lentimicrobium sp.]